MDNSRAEHRALHAAQTPSRGSFSATGPVAFALVQPTETDGIYHVREFDVTMLAGTFAPTIPNLWCWVWMNEGTSIVILSINLMRRPAMV